MEVAHLNGDRLDNRAANLAWKTRSQNAADKFGHGTDNRGKRHYKCKLSDDQVREIRACRDSARIISERYGISLLYVYQVRNGHARKHVISKVQATRALEPMVEKIKEMTP